MRTILILAAALAAHAQTQPAFDVASVRLTQHGRGPDGWSRSSLSDHHGTLTAENESLQGLIQWAYNVKEYQISGPEWLNFDEASYDITAKTSPDTPRDEMRLMLQRLLAERLQLTVHRDTRTLSGMELVVAKGGPKFTESTGEGRSGTNSRGGDVTATQVSMADFANNLSRWMHQAVIDNTGLTGNYDFKLSYEPNENQDGATKPSIFAALQDQLGLKLNSAKIPLEVIVIDHAERIPAEN
jgi:uncharacterized protein (TIGR03435 family)